MLLPAGVSERRDALTLRLEPLSPAAHGESTGPCGLAAQTFLGRAPYLREVARWQRRHTKATARHRRFHLRGPQGSSTLHRGGTALWNVGEKGAHRQLEVEGVTRKQVRVASGAEALGSRSGGRPGQGEAWGGNSVGRSPEAPGCGPGSVPGWGRQCEAGFMIPGSGRAGVQVRAWAWVESGLCGVNLPPPSPCCTQATSSPASFPWAPFGCCFSDMDTNRENWGSPSSRPGRERGF